MGATRTGKTWTATNVTEETIPFMQDIFANPNIMAGFAGGQLRDRAATKKRMEEQWMPRFQKGQPHGGLVIRDDEGTPIGHVVAGGGDGAGTSEIAYSFMPEWWNQGYGTSVVGEIVEAWGPTVRRIGLGRDPVHTSEETVKAFTCFDEQVLDQFDATASPRNAGSWRILDRHRFSPAATNLSSEDPVADFDHTGMTYPEMEAKLVERFDVDKTDKSDLLKAGVRYRMIDTDGNPRTVSRHTTWECMKYHFEQPVVVE